MVRRVLLGLELEVALLERPASAPANVAQIEAADQRDVARRLIGADVGNQAPVAKRAFVTIDDEHAPGSSVASDDLAGAAVLANVAPEHSRAGTRGAPQRPSAAAAVGATARAHDAD